MNALRITEKQIDILASLLNDYRKIGGEKVIISDLSLLGFVKDMGLKATISSCVGVRNQYTVQMLKSLGCERIIFPRDITLDEVAMIKKMVPDMEYEVFLSNSGCKFSDGNCLGLHGSEVGALCDYCRKTKPAFYRTDYDALSNQEKEYLEGQSYTYNHLLMHACAQCALYQMKGCVDSLKIVGRAANEEKICSDISLAKKNLLIAEACTSNEEYLQKVVPPNEGKWCTDYMNCYYRADMVKKYGIESE